ncbi:MAG: hypothetical protein M3P11_01125 [Actinomycetota bacterium]|nr:hypothetical protein [Actinomycetota bacterium]
MRKMLIALTAASLVLSLSGLAQAAEQHHEKYQSSYVNAFWHSKVTVDSDTYLRITWYVGAYDNGTDGFFSDAYRDVARCQVLTGRDRCNYSRALSWYGYTRRSGVNSFTIDKQLTAGHLDAYYKLYVDKTGELVGRFHIVTDLAGTGDLTFGRQRYTEHQGCTTFKYSGKFEYRQATATGTIALGDETATDLGKTNDANFGASQFIDISHTC